MFGVRCDSCSTNADQLARAGRSGLRRLLGLPTGEPVARFVVHRMEGEKSLNALTEQIARKIAERAADIISRMRDRLKFKPEALVRLNRFEHWGASALPAKWKIQASDR